MKQKMILRNFKLHIKTPQKVFHLETSYVILKVSRKNPEEKHERLDRGKERETQGRNERDMEGKEEGRKQLEQT